MTWVRLDDKFHDNPKQLRASHVAVRVWVCSMSYCADTADPTGFISAEQAIGFVRKLGATRAVISELVKLGAWEEVDDGYILHDFEHYVPPRSTERVRAFRKRKRNADETLSAGNGIYPVPDPVPVPDPEPAPVVFKYPSVGSPNSHPTLNMTRLGEHLPKVLRGGQ